MPAPSIYTQLYLPLSLLFQRMRCPSASACVLIPSRLLQNVASSFIVFLSCFLQNYSFTGSFPFKHAWLTHILKYASSDSASSKDPLVFLTFPFGPIGFSFLMKPGSFGFHGALISRFSSYLPFSFVGSSVPYPHLNCRCLLGICAHSSLLILRTPMAPNTSSVPTAPKSISASFLRFSRSSYLRDSSA